MSRPVTPVPSLCLWLVPWLWGCSPGGFVPGTLKELDLDDTAHTDSGTTVTPADTGPTDTGAVDDSGTPPDDTDTPSTTEDPPAPPDPCAGLTDGLCWVRTHPMMISGLVVSMGDPGTAAANTYYDDFGANTTHLWATGLPDETAAWAAARGADHQWISWVGDDGTSATNGLVTGGLGADPAGRVAYQIGDEPHDMDDLLALQAGIDAVRAADPDGLIIVNFGNTDTWDELEQMVDHYATTMGGDVISYDYYGYHYDTYQRLETHRRIAMSHGLPYWRYLKAYSDPGDASNWPDASDMRWDAFKGLVYGFTGHTWFLYQVDPAHNLDTTLFTQTGSWSASAAEGFHLAAELNQELAVLGESIVQLTSTDVRYTASVDWYAPDGTTPWSPGAGGDPYLSGIAPIDLDWDEFQDVLVGFFTDVAGEWYVMLQNPTHAHADWPLMVEDEATFRLDFDFTGATAGLDTSGLQVLDKTSGSLDTLALTTLGGDQAAVEVTLDAGDVVFFKYKTGAAFVR